ncbi:MAG: lasso peptide biosynthesis B2 protein [Thermoanaerobaculia bacterium]
MLGKLRKLFALPWADRALLAEAALALAASRLAVLLVPFRWIAPRLGETMAHTPREDPADPELLRRIGWSVSVASRNLPWTSRCLAEAIAGKMMLKRRGVPSTLYLGLAKQGEVDLEAHAWLRCGSRVLTGERVSEGYTVIASFAEPTPESRRR